MTGRNLEPVRISWRNNYQIDHAQLTPIRPAEKTLRVLVACETSNTVRQAFADLGHDAWSCDILPSDDPRNNKHIQCDVRDILGDGWDLLAVMHPPCTRLCNSGVRWLHVPPPGKTREQMWAELDEGAALFSACWNAPIERICVENPQMHKHAKERIANYSDEAAQWVQPYFFGDEACKLTGLWRKNLPALKPTNKLTPPAKGDPDYSRWQAVHLATPGPDRWKVRSKFWPGIARAMAAQWGGDARQL